MLAYALDPMAARAFVLEGVEVGRRDVVRLLELNLEDGSVRSLAETRRSHAFDTHALAVAPDGNLYLAASSSVSRRHVVLRLGTTGHRLSLRGSTAARGALVGILRADYLGVSMPVTTTEDGTWQVIGHLSMAFGHGPRADFSGCF